MTDPTHDHETPECPVCRERIGLHTDGLLMLRGQFFYNKEEEYAMFILDPDTKIVFLEIPDGLGPGEPQYAVVVDSNTAGPAFVAHSLCAEEELAMIEDDDDGEDDEDLDEKEHAVIDRDDMHWDEDDLLTSGSE